jgi:hypothetical protein
MIFELLTIETDTYSELRQESEGLAYSQLFSRILEIIGHIIRWSSFGIPPMHC